jgi:hypothetical protein
MDFKMGYINISPRGKAILKNGAAAATVAAAIARDKEHLSSEGGVVVRIGEDAVTIKSAATQSAEVLAG